MFRSRISIFILFILPSNSSSLLPSHNLHSPTSILHSLPSPFVCTTPCKYFVKFKLKSSKSNGSRENITLNPPTSKLFGSLDWSVTLEISGIGKNEKSPLRSFPPTIYPKTISVTCNIWCLPTKLPNLLQFGPLVSKYARFLYTTLTKKLRDRLCDYSCHHLCDSLCDHPWKFSRVKIPFMCGITYRMTEVITCMITKWYTYKIIRSIHFENGK